MKIAIAGFGKEGQANYEYYRRQGHDITIVDEQELPAAIVPKGVQVRTGADVFRTLDGFDMVVRTAGLSPAKIKTDGQMWSGTNEFFARCPAPIIGVTGSKGKGTTSSFIASILRASGNTVHLLGNIGDPAIASLGNIVASDIVVYELSSFQLWDAVKSPHVAVVLGIEPEHLDVHKDFEEYVSAKANIARFQTEQDTIVYKAANQYSTAISELSQGSKIPYQQNESAHVSDGFFWYGTVKICSTDTVQLAGAHNLDNACAAIDATRQWVQEPATIAKGLHDFTGLPHRLKFVKEVRGVSYYDDSIATTPGSAIAALRAFDAPKVMILGGSYKGADYDELAKEVAVHAVSHCLLIGDEASKIEKALQENGVKNNKNLGSDITMSEIVRVADNLAHPGDVVVLSPACASFGMFKNYVDRGEQFIAAVENL